MNIYKGICIKNTHALYKQLKNVILKIVLK